MTTTQHPPHVDADDAAFFEREGYFVYHHQLFPQAKFDHLKSFFEGMLHDLPEKARPEGMDTPHFGFPELYDWLLADEVLDFVEAFLGPDIILWSSHFLCKLPGRGLSVPWHEDSAYWGDQLRPHKVMTVWLAIDDSMTENGCMRVIPRSHDNGFSDYEEIDGTQNVFARQIKPEQVDENAAVDLVLKQGECHCHHAKMIHGSNPNTSDKRRCGYTMRYMPADVAYDPGPQAGHHAIYLARGEDRAGNSYADPAARFEPGANRWRGGS